MTARPLYLRASAIAKILGLCERTVRRRIADGTFPSVKVGGARLVSMLLLNDRFGIALADDLPKIDEQEADE